MFNNICPAGPPGPKGDPGPSVPTGTFEADQPLFMVQGLSGSMPLTLGDSLIFDSDMLDIYVEESSVKVKIENPSVTGPIGETGATGATGPLGLAAYAGSLGYSNSPILRTHDFCKCNCHQYKHNN